MHNFSSMISYNYIAFDMFRNNNWTSSGWLVEASWNVMAHAQKPDFVFRAKRTSPFKSADGGRQFSRLLAAPRCAASAVVMLGTMLRGSVKGTGYPLHSPVSPTLNLLCVTVCHHISTGLYMPSYGCMKTWVLETCQDNTALLKKLT